MRGKITPELLVVLVLVALITAFAIWSAAGDTGAGFELVPVRTTYSATPGGCKAFYALLERRGLRPARLRQPWGELPAGARILFVLSPTLRPTTEEWDDLRPWIRGGGLLVLSPSQVAPAVPTETPEWVATYPTLPDGMTTGVESLDVYRHPRPMEYPTLPRPERPWQDPFPLLADGTREAVSYARYGQGGVLLLSGPEAVANEGIARGGNLRFFLNLVGGAPAGTVLFDEYHHGHGYNESQSLWKHLPRDVRLGLVHLGLAGLILMWALSRRGAAPLPLPVPPRERSEYLDSMATLLGRAHATGLVARTRRRRFGDEMGRLLGVPAEPAAIVRALSARDASLGREAEDVLRRLDAWSTQQRPAASDLLALAEREAKILEATRRLR